MADITIQKQGEVFISQSEYDALRLAGNLQSNTKYHITKTPKTGIDTMTNLDLTHGNTTIDYAQNGDIAINGQARFTYDGGTTKDVTMKIDLPLVAGTGVTFYKYDGEERFTVELDPGAVTEMVLGTPSQSTEVLALGSAGVEYYELGFLLANGVPQYSYDSKLMAYTDGEEITNVDTDTILVNKAYANQHYMTKRSETTQRTQAYVKNPNGTQSMYDIAQYHHTNTIAVRGEGGKLQVGTPVGVNDATTKAYVDGLHHYSHHIEIRDATSEIYITLAIKNYPNPVTTLDGVTELVGALTGQMQPIMATGVVDGHNVHAVLVQSDQKLYVKFYDSTKGILTDKVQVLLNDTATVSDIVA